MAVYVGNNRATLVHGDYHPAALYKGNTRIAGWDESTKPLPATWENTYNDAAQVTISGASTQAQSVWSTNLISNGDFSDGTDGWVISAPVSVVDGRLFFNGTGDAYAFQTSLTMPRTRQYKIYYIAFDYEHISGDGVRLFNNTSFTFNTTGRKSYRGDILGTPILDDVNGCSCYIDNILCVDLTAEFGAGNEPAQAVCDALYANWFDEKSKTTTDITTYSANSPSVNYPAAIQPINGVTIMAGGQTVKRAEVLRGMGDTRDTLDVTGGILARRRGVKIFDGTETPGGFSERTNTVRVQYTITGKAANGTSTVRILSSHGCSTPDKYWSLDEEGICELKNDNFAQIIISVAKTRLSEVSANGVKAWLAAQYAAGTPITVEYDLATPTTEAVASNATNSVQGGTTVGAGSNLAVCDFASIPSWRWSMQTNNVGMHVVYIAAANLPNYGYQPIKLLANGLCSHFPWRKGQEDFWNRAETCITGGTGSSAGFSITQNFAATIDEWIAWMTSEKAAGRPLTIAYEVDGWASMVPVDGTAVIKILGN